MVSVNIDLNTGQAHAKIEALRAHLGSISDEDFDLDGFLDSLDDISDNFDDISKRIRRTNKELDDFNTNGLQFHIPDGGQSTGVTHGGGSSGNDPPKTSIRRFFDFLTRDMDRVRAPAGAGGGRAGTYAKKHELVDFHGDFGPLAPDRAKQQRKLTRRLGSMRERLSKVRGVMSKLRPSMRKWWSLLALVLPLLVSFGTAAAGAASAMGGLAVAGASVLALGLVGHGDDLSESWENAQSSLSDLANELFNVFQPAAQAFAPITDEFIDFAPGELIDLSRAIEEFTVFEDVIFDAFSGFTDWLAEGARGITANADAISQLSMRFGDLLGQNIFDLFSFLLTYASENQEMLIQLGQTLEMIALIIVHLSEVFSRWVIAARPILWVILQISEAINGPFMSALFGSLVVFGMMITTILGVARQILYLRIAMMLLGTTWQKTLISMATATKARFMGMLSWIYTTIASLNALQAALAATGIGAALVVGGHVLNSMRDDGPPSGGYGGGGPSPSAPSSGRSSGTVVNNYNTEIVNQGEMSTDVEQRTRSEIRRSNREERATERPNPESQIQTSDTDN